MQKFVACSQPVPKSQFEQANERLKTSLFHSSESEIVLKSLYDVANYLDKVWVNNPKYGKFHNTKVDGVVIKVEY